MHIYQTDSARLYEAVNIHCDWMLLMNKTTDILNNLKIFKNIFIESLIKYLKFCYDLYFERTIQLT